MADRYATIVKNDEGEEEISNIAQMEGVPPEVRDDQKKQIKVEKVADGVLIGMVRGGKINAVGGFGFPEGADYQTRSGIGATRNADTKTPDVPSSDPDAKSRATAVKA